MANSHTVEHIDECYPTRNVTDKLMVPTVLEYPSSKRRQQQSRSRNSLRHRTQPVTLTEISEVDEDGTCQQSTKDKLQWKEGDELSSSNNDICRKDVLINNSRFAFDQSLDISSTTYSSTSPNETLTLNDIRRLEHLALIDSKRQRKQPTKKMLERQRLKAMREEANEDKDTI